MTRLIRSGQIRLHISPDMSARAGFGRNFYSVLMRAEHREKLVEQAIAAIPVRGLMRAGGYISQGVRSTLR